MILQTQEGSQAFGLARRAGAADMAFAFFQLSRLLSVGVTLDESLKQLCDCAGSRSAPRVWKNIALQVGRGRSLSDAIAASDYGHEKTLVSLLRAGEGSGQLDEACRSISDYLQWKHDMQKRMATILIYPLFSLFVLTGVTGFLFVSVVPAIKGFLESAGSQLDWHTLLLINTSTWLSEYSVTALVVVFFMWLLVAVIVRASPTARLVWHAAVIKVPVIGSLVVDLSLSRYSQCCGSLYGGGVVLESALELAEATVSNCALRKALQDARLKMIAGESLANSLRSGNMLPAYFSSLLQVGEYSGQLASIFLQIAEHRKADAENAIKRIEQLIGPVLLTLVGAMLLWIVVSVLGPVYSLAITTVVAAS